MIALSRSSAQLDKLLESLFERLEELMMRMQLLVESVADQGLEAATARSQRRTAAAAASTAAAAAHAGCAAHAAAALCGGGKAELGSLGDKGGARLEGLIHERLREELQVYIHACMHVCMYVCMYAPPPYPP